MSAEPAPHALLRPKIALAFAVTTLVWGSTWFVIKDQLDDAPFGWSIAWRFVIAAIAMTVLVMLRRQSFRIDKGGHFLAVIYGLLQFSFNFHLLYRAEEHLTSGVVAMLFGISMLPNALLAFVFLGHRITGRFMLGTAVALVGISLMLLHEIRMADVRGLAWLGIGLTISSITTASVASVIQATQTAHRQPILPWLAWALGWGALFNLLAALLIDGAPVLPLDVRYLGGVAFLGLFGSALTFPFYLQLVRALGPGRAAYITVVIPIIAMLISTLLEGYRWSWLAAAGGLVALAGMVLALRGRELPGPVKD